MLLQKRWSEYILVLRLPLSLKSSVLAPESRPGREWNNVGEDPRRMVGRVIEDEETAERQKSGSIRR